jgi:hypothetical protein
MREKATKDKTQMLDLLAPLKAKGNVQKSDLKLFGIDEAKFEGRGSDAVSRSNKSGSVERKTEMDQSKITFMTAPTEMAVTAFNAAESTPKNHKTAQKAKPVKAIEPIVEQEAEDILPKISTERKASVV